MAENNNMMEILKKAGVMQEGHFLLTSGRHSNRYLQCAKLFQNPEYNAVVCKFLADKFKEDKIDLVVGPAVGGIIISYEMARQLHVDSIYTERENGIMTLRRGFEIPEHSKVLVVEDVVTTGGSVFEVIDIVKKANAEVKGVAVIVDRSNGSVDFGVKMAAAVSIDVESYNVEDCPLCKNGIPYVKPGSRGLK